MNRDELRETLRIEGIREGTVRFLDERSSRSEDAVHVEKTDAGWCVYLTSERAGIERPTLREFADESDAYDYALLKARQHQRVADLFAEGREQR